jgi:hypothetical protein
VAVVVRDKADLRERFDPGVLLVEFDAPEGFLHAILDVLEIEAFKNRGASENHRRVPALALCAAEQ